jgi:hypothetical protein
VFVGVGKRKGRVEWRNVISNGKPVVWALAVAVAVAVSVFPSTQAFRREVEVDEKSAD